MKSIQLIVTCSMGLILLTGCQTTRTSAVSEAAAPPTAIPISLIGVNNQVVGNAVLTAVQGGVQLDVQVKGLPPGVHGIHIHEKSACIAPTFDSAGAHFNPQMKEHGFLNPKGFHAGDLPNLVVDAQGNGTFSNVTKSVVLTPNKSNSLIKPDGFSVVIHEKEDDLKTDPSGNSGKRIACGGAK